MTRTVRAGGIAAAVLGFAFSALAGGGPLKAWKSEAAPVAASYLDHAAATMVYTGFGENRTAAQASAMADRMAGLAEAAMPRPRSLGELVSAYQRTGTANDEQDCLANAVYFEARGEPIDGQLAVAQVVLNRVASKHYPDSICDVVVEPWQFSFVQRGRIPAARRESAAWRKAVAIARIAEEDAAAKLRGDVLWYHADYVAPSWGKRLDRQTKIGLHIFYA